MKYFCCDENRREAVKEVARRLRVSAREVYRLVLEQEKDASPS